MKKLKNPFSKMSPKSKKIALILASVSILIAIIYVIAKRNKAKNYTADENLGSDKPTSDGSYSSSESINWIECDSWWGCFPLKKGSKDKDPTDGYVASLQKYLGISSDGYFGSVTESAVLKAINKKEVNSLDYASIKSAYDSKKA